MTVSLILRLCVLVLMRTAVCIYAYTVGAPPVLTLIVRQPRFGTNCLQYYFIAPKTGLRCIWRPGTIFFFSDIDLTLSYTSYQ